jgi:hypothetical protein
MAGSHDELGRDRNYASASAPDAGVREPHEGGAECLSRRAYPGIVNRDAGMLKIGALCRVLLLAAGIGCF